MGFWSRLLRGEQAVPFDTYDAAQRVLPEPYEPFQGYYYGSGIPVADPGVPLTELGRQAVEAVWRTQPNVRKVVDFIARNVASIPLHTFERISDTDRRRVHDGALAGVVAQPAERVSPYRFWHAVLSDGLLYDRWAVLRVAREDGGESLVQIPSWRLRFQLDALRRVTAAWYWVGDTQPDASAPGGWKQLDLDLLIFDHGYAPRSAGVSPLETLADILAETAEAVRYRHQVWRNGARVPAWIERPPANQATGVPAWSAEAREKFKAGFRAAYAGDGPDVGGVPLMEDGMKLHEFKAFSPQDLADLEGRRLSAIEVAAAYHIAPELVGAREGTYSNVDAFRQMLYRDSLGPYITAWEGALNAQLVPALSEGRSLYVEANVESKLRGSFLEQAQVMQSATGAPWLTRNEARALQNRPPVDGGDELVVPLNVLVGGQASPTDSGSQNRRADTSTRVGRRALLKARATERHTAKIAEVLRGFFKRQSATVLSAIGAGRDWWDGERWDKELADDLHALAVTVAEALGKAEAEALGYEADDYDADATVNFLRAASERYARNINLTTKAQLDEAVSDDDGDPAHVFDVAQESRADGASAGIGTFLAGFATVEAARQIARSHDVQPTKTWVTGVNPRPAHAAMDGETVPLDEDFSNGLPWPGAAEGSAEDNANCNCSLQINV